jgi:hypothetical protein
MVLFVGYDALIRAKMSMMDSPLTVLYCALTVSSKCPNLIAATDYLALDGLEDDPMLQIHGYSINYRIATGKQQGRKVFTWQTIAPMAEQGLASCCAANVAGFSLHAGVMSNAQDRGKLERLYRYITRSGVSEKRLAITTYPKVRYQLKTSYRDGTTGDRRSHVIFEPLDFIARLAALVPKPRVNLTRFHGVFVRGGPSRAIFYTYQFNSGSEKYVNM